MYNVLFTLNFELSWYGTSYRTFLQPKIQSWREICSKLRRWKMLPGVQRMIHSKHAQFLQYCLSLQYYAHISGICPTWGLMEDRRGIDITILIEQAPIPGAQSCISSPYLSLANIPCYLLCTVCERGYGYLWNSPVFQRCSEREYIILDNPNYQFYITHTFSFEAPFTVLVDTFWAIPEFTNVHLPQWVVYFVW